MSNYSHLPRQAQIELIKLKEEYNRRFPVRPRKANKPQSLAIKTKSDWLFYGGAAGGGKTYLIIILALTQHKRSCIYRRTYKQGLQIRDTLHKIVTAAGGSSRHDKTEFELNGRLVHFRSLDHWDAVEGLQGNEYDLMAFDECTQFPQMWIDYLSTWNRSPDKDQICRIVLTSNPPTSSDGAWVKLAFAKWIDKRHPKPAASGEVAYFVNANGVLIEVENDQPVEIDGEIRHPHSRCFIQANALDNPDLGEKYYNKLDSLPEMLRMAFKYGNWDVMDIDGANQFFPSAWIEAAVERYKTYGDGLPLHSIGCDVAGSADIEKRTTETKASSGGKVDNSSQGHYDGNKIVRVVSVSGSETRGGKMYRDWLKGEMIRYGINNNPHINIDSIWGGAYEYVNEDEFFAGKVNAVHFGMGLDMVTDDGMLDLHNVKTALYWYFRTRLDPNHDHPIGIPNNHQLIAQLKAINFSVVGRKLTLERKIDMRDRVGFSPDDAEACIYALAHEIM